MKRIILLLWSAVLLAVFYAPSAHALGDDSPLSFQFPRPLKVLTQNMYVGVDLLRVLGGPPESIPFIVAGMFQDIMASDVPGRAAAVARSVAEHRPDVIGLQEAMLLRIQSPGDAIVGGQVPAEFVVMDFLQALQIALVAEGLDYEVAAVQENVDVEMPMFAGLVNGVPQFDDARLTDRDVILRRSGVTTDNVLLHSFDTVLVVPVAGQPLVFKRGFIALDATVRHRTYRIVNTHLESVVDGPLAAIQSAQAYEILTALAGETRPVVVLGDLNSAPEDAPTQPYWLFTAAGYVDAWTRRLGPSSPGYTCCQDELLDNLDSVLFTRIDHVFIRNRHPNLPFPLIGPVLARTVGDQADDKTAGGLWPSDHAGVEALLFLPIVTGGL